MSSSPTPDDLEDIILSARYGELEEVQEFVQKYGIEHVESARDERGNGCLHMAAANGHTDIIGYILPLLKSPAQAISACNDAGNSPLHWASMNGHLEVLKLLVPALPSKRDASPLFVKNSFGKTALSEAETRGMEKMEDNASAGTGSTEDQDKESKVPKNKWMDCADYLLSFMELENEAKTTGQEDDSEEMTEGVARMGVASKSGGFEYEERKA